MATKKKTEDELLEVEAVATEEYDPYEKVEIRVPRGGANDEANLFISINCVNYLIPKGKTSMVPRCVADEYERMQAAEEQFYAKMDELVKQGEQ